MLDIDGSHGEGGGQLLRTAVALAAITGREVTVRDIRAKRAKPGLAPQHVVAVRAVAALCRGRVEGLSLRSREVRLAPGALTGGEYRFDIGTAGSISLVLQAILPVMTMSAATTTVTVTGGTDVRQAPPVDYLRHVLLPLLARMGIRVELDVIHRGYYPRGGGEARISVMPVPSHRLQPLALDEPGDLVSIRGHAHVSRLPEHIAIRMRDAAFERLAPVPGVSPRVDVEVLDPARAVGTGGGIVMWAQTQGAVLGAARVAERGIRAETLGNAVGDELAADLAAGATVDLHAADQLLVYFALAQRGSYLVRSVTTHARTAMWLIEQFLPVRFALVPKGDLIRLTLVSLGGEEPRRS